MTVCAWDVQGLGFNIHHYERKRGGPRKERRREGEMKRGKDGEGRGSRSYLAV